MSVNKITPKNILNHGKNKNKITLDNLLDKATTDNVSDAMKKVCGKNGVIRNVKPVDGKSKIVGKIRTAQTNSTVICHSISTISGSCQCSRYTK